MHTEAADFLGGLRPIRKQTDEVGVYVTQSIGAR